MSSPPTVSGLSTQDVLFAAFAVHIGLVTPNQVAAAITGKAALSDKSLADRLESEGVINSEQKKKLEEWVDYEMVDGHATVEVHSMAGGPEEGLVYKEEPTADVEVSGEKREPDDSQAEQEKDDSGAPPVKVFDDFGKMVTFPQKDRYQVHGVHAVGGQAKIMHATDDHVGREIAIKEFAPGKLKTGTLPQGSLPAVARFLREARVTGQLEHPNIVPVHEVGRREDGSLYYTMRLVRGKTLEDKLADCKTLADRLKLLGVFWDLCKAIAFAHSRGVVHRDIKPENVMVGEFGETLVIDWGIAKVTGKRDIPANDIEHQIRVLQQGLSGSTLDGTTIGTPAYMSPEQAEGNVDDIDERSDVWSLGAILYEILTGITLYQADTPAAIMKMVGRKPQYAVSDLEPEAPAELVAVIDKALQRDRRKRYQRARELADEVGAYMTGRRVDAYEYSSLDVLKRFATKNRTAFIGATLSILVIIAALVSVAVLYGQEQSGRRMANFHLAQAYAQKADRMMDDLRLNAARAFASASLLYNPAHPQSPFYVPDFAEAVPKSLELMAEAASTNYRVKRETTLELNQVIHSEDVPFQLAYSPDGERLAVGCDDKTVVVWQMGSFTQVMKIDGHRKRVHGVTYSPDGRYLASASYDRTLKLWDAGSGRWMRTFSGHTDKVTRLAFSPDSTRLASASFDGTVRIWNRLTGKALGTLRGHNGRVRDVAFSPDGKRLASSGVDKTVRIWDAESHAELMNLGGHTNSVARVRFSPDGKWLASAGYDGKIQLWDAKKGMIRATLEGHSGHVYSLAFSPDSTWLASGGFDTSFRLWDVASGRCFFRLHGHQAAVNGLSFSPDGKQLASCGYDKRIKIWTIHHRDSFPELTGHTDKIYALSYSKDGKFAATGSWDRTVRVWDAVAGKRLRTLKKHTGYVNAVAIDPAGTRLASSSWDKTVKVWELQSGKTLYQIEGHGGLINPVAFSPDGAFLVSGQGDRDIGIWKAENGEPVKTLQGHTDKVYALAFSPDGNRLVSASHDKTVRIWNITTGKHTKLEGHQDLVTGVDWSPDGRWIASCGSDRQAILWNADDGSLHKRLEDHNLWVNSVRFSQDSKLLASASDDLTVRIWSVENGEPLLVLRTEKEVAAIHFTPDGKALSLGDGDRVVQYPLDFSVLKVSPQVLLEEAERTLGRKLDGFQLKIAESLP